MEDSTTSRHRGWHNRLYLPHFDSPALIQAVTFRLADALPPEVLSGLVLQPQSRERRIRIDEFLDTGLGSCVLSNSTAATIVEDALLYFESERYRLIAWCVMPNHVHVLVEPAAGFRLGDVVHSWKSYTAKAINAQLGRAGPLWQADYYDRFIRNEEHLQASIAYIEENPVKANLAKQASDWQWSSARRRLA
jgi:REP element-mobilizing transposase RayT